MKIIRRLVFAVSFLVPALAWAAPEAAARGPHPETRVPIRPGEPGVRPFWNGHAKRFVYAPAFDFPATAGAVSYRFKASSGGRIFTFDADRPWASLAPIWEEIPEGAVELGVEALDGKGKVLGVVGNRIFYRAAPFTGEGPPPALDYADAGRLGLRALFRAAHVQNWLKTGAPDPDYRLYCYPSKVMGGLLRGMTAYARVAEDAEERRVARAIAQRVADHLVSISLGSGAALEYFPPTYALNVKAPLNQARKGVGESHLMLNSPCDAALAYLDYYDLSEDGRFLEAARRIAATYARTQEADGTWPLLANFKTGEPLAPNRLVPTWVIFLFDRLERSYRVDEFRAARERAWQYIVDHPLRTFAWDAQFEDVKPQPLYRNLAREQACDVARIIFEQGDAAAGLFATAKELLAFAEDQFVVWSPIRDPEGAVRAGLRANAPQWMPPCVLEQYSVYEPVARSSAVMITAYLAAYSATHEAQFLSKARALANGLVEGQRYQMREHGGEGEVPTWLVRRPPSNWLNNSYYAADSLLQVARVR